MSENVANIQQGMSDESIRLMITPSDIAKRTFLYVQETGYLEIDTTFSFESVNMDSFLLLDVTDGTGTLIYDNNEFQLEPDNLVLIDCKKYHSFYTKDTWGCHLLYSYFNGRQAREYYNLLSKPKNPIFKIENSKTTGALFWQIIALHRNDISYAESLTSLHITRILTEISMQLDKEIISNADYPVYINDVFHHIGHYYKEKITLDILAQLFAVNKYYLSREFKRCAGMTINEYLLQTRINKAKSFLRYTNKSVEQIADEIGFYNSSHFIKLFHQRELVTPLFYRKQWTS